MAVERVGGAGRRADRAVGDAIGFGWRGALGVWAVPPCWPGWAWAAQVRAVPGPPSRRAVRPGAQRPGLAGDDLLRAAVVVVLRRSGLVAFHLPGVGISPAAAGLLLSVAGLAADPVALVLLRWRPGRPTRLSRIAGSTVLIGLGLAGALVAPTSAPYLWAILIGDGRGHIAPGSTVGAAPAPAVHDHPARRPWRRASVTSSARSGALLGLLARGRALLSVPIVLLLVLAGASAGVRDAQRAEARTIGQ